MLWCLAMAKNQSEGIIQITDNSPTSINDALRQTTDRIDALKGLRGRASIFDRVGVSDAIDTGDAVNLNTLEGRISTTVSLNPGRMVYATDYIAYVDANGQTLHGMGNI